MTLTRSRTGLTRSSFSPTTTAVARDSHVQVIPVRVPNRTPSRFPFGLLTLLLFDRLVRGNTRPSKSTSIRTTSTRSTTTREAVPSWRTAPPPWSFSRGRTSSKNSGAVVAVAIVAAAGTYYGLKRVLNSALPAFLIRLHAALLVQQMTKTASGGQTRNTPRQNVRCTVWSVVMSSNDKP